MGNDDRRAKTAHVLKKYLQGDTVSIEDVKRLPVEELIEHFNILHQELEYQNIELADARLAADLIQARYKDLFENAPFGYVIFDYELKITAHNRAFVSLFRDGYPNLKGVKITDFLQSSAQDQFHLYLKRAVATLKKGEEEFQFGFEKAREQRFIKVRTQYFKPVPESPGKAFQPGEFRMLLVDVTGQKKHEERLISLLNNLPVGVIAADGAPGKAVFCNQTMLNMLGLTEELVIGRDVLSFHQESDKNHALQEYQKGSALNVTLRRPFVMRHATGRPVFVTVSAVALSLFSGTYWCGVYTEVTSQLKSIERAAMLQDIVDRTSDFIGSATVEGKVIYANDTFRTRLGYDIENDLLGHPIFELHPGWVQQLLRETALPEALKHGRWEGESAVFSKNGDEIPVSQLIIRHDKPDGSVDYLSTSLRDISERKEIERLRLVRQHEKEKADQRLRQEQQKMELILSQAPDAVISVDGSLVIRFLNQKAQRMFGIGPDVTDKKKICELIPQLKQLTDQNHRDELKTIQGYDFELFDRTGTPFWGQLSVSFVDFEDEVFFTFFIRDITERKQNEELLIQNTRRLNEIALNSRTMAWEVDADGLYTFVSPVCETVLGYKASELVGRKTLFDLHPEEGREDFVKDVKLSMMRKERFSSYYNKMETRDKRVIWVSTNGLPVLDDNRKLVGYRGCDTEVTELIETEQRNRLLQKAVESSTVGIVLTDMRKADQPLIYVNPAFEQITGYSPDNVLGKNCRFLQGNDRLQSGVDIIRKSVQEGKSCRVTLRNYRKDGQLFWNQLSLSPIFDDQNNLTHFIGVQHDVTKLKEAEAAMIRQTALQSFLLSVSGRFVNIVTGEFEQILTEVLAESADMIHADRVCLVRLNSDGEISNAFCGSRVRVENEMYRIPAEEWPKPLFESYHKGENIFIHDARALPDGNPFKAWLKKRGTRGFTAIPLMSSGNCTGYIVVENASEPLVLEREHRGMLGILVQLLVNLYNRVDALVKITQSEEKFAMAFQSSPYAIAITDPLSGRFLEVNNAFYQITGYSQDDVIESRITSLNIWANKDNRAIMKNALERGETVDNLEFEFRKKNGELFTALLSSRVIHIDSKHYYITSINDISERLAAQRKLAESEEKYRLLFTANKDAITIFSLDSSTTEVVETNVAASELTGYPLEELRGMKISDLEPELTPEIISQRSESLYNNAEVNYETRIRTKSGTVKDIEVKSVLIFYEDRPSFMTISRDITQRKQEEYKLRELIQRNNAILSAIPDMMFMFNRDKEIIDFSSGDTSMLLDTAKGFLGKTISQALPSEVAKDANKKVDAVLATGQPDSFTYFLMVRRVKRFFEARFVLCGTDQVMAIVRDVTESKEAEREILRFSRIFESSINEIYLFNTGDYRIQVMNPAAMQNLGYTADEVPQLDAMQVADVTRGQLHEALSPLLTGEEDIVIMEATHKRKDGSTYNVQSYIQLITYEDEQLFAGIVVDITERLQYLRYLEDQNKVLRDISWTQSHLVRAPLARMMSLIMLLQEKDFETFSESEILKYLSDSAAEIDKMIYDIALKTEKTVFRPSE